MRIVPASPNLDSRPRGRHRERQAVRELVSAANDSAITLLDCHDARFWYPWHFHPEVEIKLVLDGSGTRTIGDSIAPFEPGDLCIVGAGTPHCWNSPLVRGHWVHARVVQFLPEIVGACPDLGGVASLLERAKLGLRVTGVTRTAFLAELDRLFAAQSPARRMAHLLTGLAIVAEGPDVVALAPAPSAAVHTTDSAGWKVLDYLSTHAVEPLTERSVAQRFGFSPAGFSRFFRREFGKSFVRYLAELRVGLASHLLVEKELRIVDIARRSGFGTVASLNRHFRAVKGATPTAYRKLARRMGQRQAPVTD